MDDIHIPEEESRRIREEAEAKYRADRQRQADEARPADADRPLTVAETKQVVDDLLKYLPPDEKLRALAAFRGAAGLPPAGGAPPAAPPGLARWLLGHLLRAVGYGLVMAVILVALGLVVCLAVGERPDWETLAGATLFTAVGGTVLILLFELKEWVQEMLSG